MRHRQTDRQTDRHTHTHTRERERERERDCAAYPKQVFESRETVLVWNSLRKLIINKPQFQFGRFAQIVALSNFLWCTLVSRISRTNGNGVGWRRYHWTARQGGRRALLRALETWRWGEYLHKDTQMVQKRSGSKGHNNGIFGLRTGNFGCFRVSGIERAGIES